MKRKILSAAALLCASFASRDASAIEFGTPERQHPYHSAQNFALELRFSPYRPQVDEEPGLVGKPFESAFGDKPRLYMGLELDWQTFRAAALSGICHLLAGVARGRFADEVQQRLQALLRDPPLTRFKEVRHASRRR